MFSFASLPLNSIVSVPSWPSTTSLPSPGSHWKSSSPAPEEARRRCPAGRRRSRCRRRRAGRRSPLLPRIVSLPAPPSTVISISAARLPVAEKLSSPPLALRTRFSEVPMSIANGAGLRRSNRTRVPLAVVVNCSAPLPPLTSTVSVPAPPSLRSVSSPGFQIIRSLPLCAEGLVVGVAAGEGVVLAAAEQEVEAALAEERVVAGLAEELVVARAAGEGVVAGAAEQVRPRQRAVGLVEGDRVVAAQAEDLDQRGVGDRRRAADDGDRAAVDQDPSRPRSRLIDDRVVGGVAEDGEHAVGERRGGCRARRWARRQDRRDTEHDTGQQPASCASSVVVRSRIHRVNSFKLQGRAKKGRWLPSWRTVIRTTARRRGTSLPPAPGQ